MTAPDTNIEKQTRRHKGPLFGMIIGAVAVCLVGLAAFSGVFSPSDDAEGEAAATTTATD